MYGRERGRDVSEERVMVEVVQDKSAMDGNGEGGDASSSKAGTKEQGGKEVQERGEGWVV
jgi:hypothetical protein